MGIRLKPSEATSYDRAPEQDCQEKAAIPDDQIPDHPAAVRPGIGLEKILRYLVTS